MPNTQTKEEVLEKKLSDIRAHGKADEYQQRAQKLGLAFADASTLPIDTEALRILPEETAKTNQIAIIARKESHIVATITDPENPGTQKIIQALKDKGFTVSFLMTAPEMLEKVLKHYELIKSTEIFETGSLEIQQKELDAFQERIKTVSDLKNQLTTISTTSLLEIMLAGGLKIHASDIHFEPEAKDVRLRYRLDGVLQDVTTLEKDLYRSLLNRVKVVSRLKLNIHGASQDGRFTIKQEDINIEVRVSVLPSEYGETVVMRLLDPRTINGKLEDLGMRPDFLEMIRSQLKQPTGALFTTGPTGSGKTTTLYAFINELNTPDEKIITIEDPIEYHIKGISQTQVEPDRGYTFANGLRAIVRQDPDIILVGEVRDVETADIALNAALTGHLVLSTLHTNDASGTVPRLIDLGIKPPIIAPAIRMAMAQRLVRRLCENCKTKKALGKERVAEVKKFLDPIADKFKVPKLSEDYEVYNPVGCEQCNNTGYKGRIGVYEAFKTTAEMERLILDNPAISQITELAIKQGMVTMKQDALLKLLDGITSFDEIVRILG